MPHQKVIQTIHDETCAAFAPEVVDGRPHDFSSDIWQLGQLAYKLVSYPTSDDLPCYLLGEQESEPLWLDWVNDDLKSLILQMVKDYPVQRPTIEDILSHPWFEEVFQ